MAEERAEVVVLGAGIAGCALAYHLAQRRVGRVVVLDPRTPAAGASGRAAGVVTEQLWDPFDVEVTRETKAEYATLAARYDPSAYTVNGFLRWTSEAGPARALRDASERLRRWGVDVRDVGADEIARWVPWGRYDDVRAAIFGPSDGVVTPSAMTELYVDRARAQGVEFWLGAPVRASPGEGRGWQGKAGSRSVQAKRLVVAAGAWSKHLLADLGRPVALVPYLTQAAVLAPEPPIPSFPSVHDIDRDVYVRPESNGRILAGDGTRLVEVDPERTASGGDPEFVTDLATAFETRFPGWAGASLVRAWSGVCSSTPDRRPLVGPVPDAPGLFALCGFNGFGVMRAGGIARRLADLLSVREGSTPQREALRSVDPGRFSVPPPEFLPRPGFTLEDGDDPRF